jgi:hypothetical protein
MLTRQKVPETPATCGHSATVGFQALPFLSNLTYNYSTQVSRRGVRIGGGGSGYLIVINDGFTSPNPSECIINLSPSAISTKSQLAQGYVGAHTERNWAFGTSCIVFDSNATIAACQHAFIFVMHTTLRPWSACGGYFCYLHGRNQGIFVNSASYGRQGEGHAGGPWLPPWSLGQRPW